MLYYSPNIRHPFIIERYVSPCNADRKAASHLYGAHSTPTQPAGFVTTNKHYDFYWDGHDIS